MKTLIAIIIIITALFGCFSKAEQTIVFEGTSMLPTIKDGEKIQIEKFPQNSDFKLERGDIVMFLHPENPTKFHIKRLIGLPKETVKIRAGKVFINGKELSEPYVDQEYNEMGESKPEVKVEENHYYFLGDNRDNSADSRIYGTVPKENIKGKVTDKKLVAVL